MSTRLHACTHLLLQSLEVVYEDYEPLSLSIPYLPGYLGFRECPAYHTLLARAAATQHAPQVGQGARHQRQV